MTAGANDPNAQYRMGFKALALHFDPHLEAKIDLTPLDLAKCLERIGDVSGRGETRGS